MHSEYINIFKNVIIIVFIDVSKKGLFTHYRLYFQKIIIMLMFSTFIHLSLLKQWARQEIYKGNLRNKQTWLTILINRTTKGVVLIDLHLRCDIGQS